MTVECNLCKNERPKRRVLVRRPLKDITDKHTYYSLGYVEFVCKNDIEVLVSDGHTLSGKLKHKWVNEKCNNHLLRDPKKYGLKIAL